MQYKNKNEKIYSRARIDLSGNRVKVRRNRNFARRFNIYKNREKFKKIMPIISVFFIAFSVFFLIWNFINPIFETICKDKAKSIATVITNEETTGVMNKYSYDTFFIIEKDDKGNIQMINANVLKINKVMSDIAVNIQKALEEKENEKIYISSGALTGVRFLAGVGPKIGIRIAPSGNIDTDLRSEFVAQGVNQTVHRVYLDIKTNVNILTSFNMIESSIENQVLIAENVIMGEIPSTYYNFEVVPKGTGQNGR